MRQERTRMRGCQQRGAALIIAIVCVSIAVAVMYGLVQLAVQAHREVGLEQRQSQARWIVESGADRAAAQLARDEDYVGEQWALPAEELGSHYDAEVRIQVERVEGEGNWRLVRVVGDYPIDLPQRVRHRREFRMQVHP